MLSLALLGLMTQTSQTYSITALRDIAPPLQNHVRGGTNLDPQGRRFEANSRFLSLDGKPWMPVMGEIHYARVPRAKWRDALRTMKANGVSIVATYCFWLYHEERQHEFDWRDNLDLRAFIKLCDEEGLKVWIRIGPWAHGEARDGGFPKWLFDVSKPRTLDPAYFAEVHRWYEALAGQMKGLYFKDGGPIMGCQLDNEFGHVGGQGGDPYILKCKAIAREVGIDVPYYSVTGWGNAWVPKDEVLPFQAAYVDGTWIAGNKQSKPPVEHTLMDLTKLARDNTTGVDFSSGRVTQAELRYDPLRYPFLTAELGGGMELGPKKRVVITGLDTEANALLRLGEGAALVGYYMFHGGSQRKGKDGQWLGEPGWSQVSYDYQAPMGQYGKRNDAYNHVKRLHLFLADFGPDLAEMTAAFPADNPKTTDRRLRVALRSKGESGFVFFSNHQRYVDMPVQEDVRFAIDLPNRKVETHPVTLPKDTIGIFPIGLPLGDARLDYATAQPLMKLRTKEGERWVFFAPRDVRPIFQFSNLKDRELMLGREIVAFIEVGDILPIETKSGRKFEFLVLSEQDSLRAWKRTVGEYDELILSDAEVWPHGEGLRIRTDATTPPTLWRYPSKATVTPPFPAIAPGRVSFTPSAPIPEEDAAYWYRHPERGETAWTIRVEDLDWKHASDHLLRLKWLGDSARLYLNGHLVDDRLWNGQPWTISLSTLLGEAKPTKVDLIVVITPWKKGQAVFVETPPPVEDDLTARIDAITLFPERTIDLPKF